MKETIKKLEELIIENKVEQALQILILEFEKIGEDELKDESILNLSRYKYFSKKLNNGTIDSFDSEMNKIRVSILNLKNNLKLLIGQFNKLKSEDVNRESKIFNEIYVDDFSQKLWDDGLVYLSNLDVIGNIKYVANRLILEHYRNEASAIMTKTIKINENSNYSFTLRGKLIEGTDESKYGFMWGMINNDFFYYFVVYATQKRASINYFFDGKFVEILSAAYFSHITNDNTLRLERKGDELYFFINDELFHTCKRLSFFGDGFGLMVGCKGKVAFDYIKIITEE